MNKPNIHNNIDISSFQNGLNHSCNSTDFYIKNKIIEVAIKWKNNMIFNFWVIFLKMYVIEVVTFFFAPSACPINSIFQWHCEFMRFIFWWRIYSLDYQNAYGYLTFLGGGCDIPRGAPTHKFAWYINHVVLWGHVTNKIHISTSRRPMSTRLGNVLI